jgi:3-methyladenine DNA glycosylase/8-oxoguanine DNA glycosylase
MAAIIASVGPFKPSYHEPTFRALARSIVFQQLAGAAARTIFNRLEAACGGDVTPAAILKLSDQQLRAVGLSKQKLSYIRSLAELTQSGEIDFAQLPKMSDEDIIEHLTRVKGIGRWTAQMFLMFALRRPDVMPHVDFGLNSAIKKHYRKRKLKPPHIDKIAKSWSPYRSIACWYLWRSLDGPIEL